jgi:chitin disaccharide deacetylase
MKTVILQNISDYGSQDLGTSKRFAIINGDDFGFSQGINQAILKAHTHGILTSTSLMVTGEACEEAVALAKAHPTLGVGLHLVLVCGRGALPQQTIPHLVDARGNFPDNPAKAGLKYQFSQAARKELRLEIRAQLEKFRQTGLSMSHVDGHLHLHAHPVVIGILLELASEFDIKVIRLPFEELSLTLNVDPSRWFAKALGWWIFKQLRQSAQKRLDSAGITYAERVYGLLKSGEMTADYLAGLIPQIRANCVEIYAHPAIALPGEPRNGPLGSGERELEALLNDDVRDALATHQFTLTNYFHCTSESGGGSWEPRSANDFRLSQRNSIRSSLFRTDKPPSP